MKKPVNLLVVLTCVFAAFLGGFYAGRCANRAPVHIYQLTPKSTEPPDQASDTQPEPETPSEPLWPLNVNTATAEELNTLPGIGPVLAQRIIDYRSRNGNFQAVEELLKVSGIGESRLSDMLDLITVETGGTK